ncbi:hypothetical protein [Clostridium niameyense]|uniref:hypothetical protein n=1 Tax=Clostridium niameyense TaxID=1622073 RepID=UPI00067F598B|nr:hypothetical protein [Clostridium niameyense]
MVSKYNSSYYWENLIAQNKPIWKGAFQNLSLTRDSKFIHCVIINYDKNIIEHNWAYYPDVKSMLGFIQYVFVPTAFFTWLSNEFNEFVVPIAPSYEILGYLKEFNKKHQENFLNIMKTTIEKLNSLWYLTEEECIKEIKDFSKEFNKQWGEKNGKLLSLNIFEDSFQIGEYIIPKNHNDVFLEVLEEEIGLTKDQWEEVYTKVYENEFMKRQFINILNYKIGCCD